MGTLTGSRTVIEFSGGVQCFMIKINKATSAMMSAIGPMKVLAVELPVLDNIISESWL